MSVLLLVVCMRRICNRRDKKMASGPVDEVAAPHRHNPEQFPVFQLVFFCQRGGCDHGGFFGTVVQPDVHKFILLAAITQRVSGDEITQPPGVLYENGQEKHCCRVLMVPRCW